MPAVEATSVAASSESDSVKMDDRKRAAAHDHNDSAPPSKKQATSVNGGNRPHPDADMPWKDDLERFQKDAIWRQMQEYKREKISFETKVRELSKATTYHNDHLRIIDAWYNQLIDEVKILLDPAKSEEDTKEQPIFQSSLQFEDVETFEKHLKSRSDDIRDVITRLLAISPKAPPAVSDLQSQLAKKLAEEKVTITELERAVGDKQQAEESLEAASLRYMVAEKKLDRAKSTTAAKLEKQYIFGAQRPGAENDSGTREESTPANGTPSAGEHAPELEVAHQRLAAESEKQKEQLQKLETENASLLNQVTDMNIKHSKHTDDDYAHTDLFKQLRSQYDDVVKRINNFEATNAQLRDEARRLTSERTAYRNQVDEETKNTIAEKEAQLVRAETDLARIRNARDELLADQQMRKAAQEQDKTASVKIQELASAREARIASLESEVERLRVQDINSKPTEIAEVPIEELRTKHQNLERQYAMLNNELASMQIACKKYSTLASQKVADFSALEEKVARFSAEKSKADQKFFAAMKAKEARDMEVRTLRMQNSKSSDIISQLKDSEAATRSLVANMEKQASEGKEALNSVGIKLQAAHQQLTENGIAMDGLRGQIAELKALSTSKDSTLANTSSNCRRAETEIEGLKVTLSDTKKSLENWKSKSLGNSSSEYEMLRTLALCTVCRRNFKNTALKTCGHVFCKDCVEERLTSRSRKCPNCNKSFGNNDHMHITL